MRSRTLIVSVLAFLLCVVSTMAAQADDLHAEWQYQTSFLNCATWVQTNYLEDNYDTDTSSFTTDEMWRNDGDSSFWQEMGYMVGNLNNQDFQGIFGAYDEAEGYVEFSIQPNPPTGLAEVWFGVQTPDHSVVQYWYNGHQVASVNSENNYSAYEIVGMEVNGVNANSQSFQSLALDYMQTQNGGNYTFWPKTGIAYYNDTQYISTQYGYLATYNGQSQPGADFQYTGP